MIEVAFWLLATAIGYVYLGYPVLLSAVRTFAKKMPIVIGAHRPSVTLVISAYNEASVIGDKIRNALVCDYPKDQLEIIVVSDASDDGTDEIVEQYEDQGVVLLRVPRRAGKTHGLNAAVNRASGDVIVFSDANAMYEPDAVTALAQRFADPEVGAVVGESTYSEPKTDAERSEGLYWRYETWIKKLESDTGSVVGGDGAIYAVRRELYEPMESSSLSDFVNPIQVVRRGYRCVFEGNARSMEAGASKFDEEFRRKVRIVNRAWRAALQFPEMLNPIRQGLFAVKMFSHKIMRWWIAVPMTLLFILNMFLLTAGWLYVLTFLLQCVFYGMALIGWRLVRRESLPLLLRVPYYFCLVNIASLVGIRDAFKGKTYTTWATVRARG